MKTGTRRFWATSGDRADARRNPDKHGHRRWDRDARASGRHNDRPGNRDHCGRRGAGESRSKCRRDHHVQRSHRGDRETGPDLLGGPDPPGGRAGPSVQDQWS
ncbi:MAG: hypothetical protein MZV64_28530 [Ignavibacteriales bacterium]|nr:hypothetical protein [Ignavibacteriales bacterium]